MPAASKVTPPSRPEVYILAVMLLLIIGFRLSLLWWVETRHPDYLYGPDSASYKGPAQALLELGRFLNAPEASAPPEISRTPGYPAFIATCYSLFGMRDAPVLIMQAILSGLIPLLIYSMTNKLADKRAGIIAVAFYGLDLNSHYISIMFISETIFTLVCLYGTYKFTLFVLSEDKNWKAIAAISILFCAAALVRPILYYLLPCLGLFLIIANWNFPRASRLWYQAAAWLIPIFLLIGGWQLRNSCVAGYSGFSSIKHINLLEYRAAGVLMYRDHITFGEAQTRLLAKVTEFSNLPPRPKWEAWDKVSLQVLRENKQFIPHTIALGIKKMMLYADDTTFFQMITARDSLDDFYGDFERMTTSNFIHKWWTTLRFKFIYSLFNTCHLYFSYSMVFVGLVVLWRYEAAKRTALILLLLVCGYQILISAGPEAYTRFRLPIAPILFCITGIGIDALLTHRNPPRKNQMPDAALTQTVANS
jgi:4-amino-4-deoxy-L-arabinose transferase-like glycosyltransferase